MEKSVKIHQFTECLQVINFENELQGGQQRALSYKFIAVMVITALQLINSTKFHLGNALQPVKKMEFACFSLPSIWTTYDCW